MENLKERGFPLPEVYFQAKLIWHDLYSCGTYYVTVLRMYFSY